MTTSPATLNAVGTPAHFNNDTSKAVGIPSGAAAGELLMLLVTVNNGAVFTKTGMTGWQPVSGSPVVNTTFNQIYAFTKVASVGEPGTNVTVGNFGATVKGVGVIVSLGNYDPVTPISVTMAGAISNTLGTAHATASATADENSTPILVVTDRASATIQTTSTWTYPAGFTNVVTNQGSTAVNTGEAGIGVAIGGEVLDGVSSGGGNATGNSLQRFASALIFVREFVPADAPQLQIMDDSGWHTVEVVGVGEDGAIHAVTLVDPLSGLHTPDVNVDFAAGTVPNPPFSFTDSVTVVTAAKDPLGTSAYGAYLKPNVSTPFATTLTKSAVTAPTNKAWASVKLRCKLVTLPGAANTYSNLLEVGNSDATAPKNQFTMYWNNRALWADFGTGDAVNLSMLADTTDWHTYEARVYMGATTYTAKVRIDGGVPIDMTSANDKEVATTEELWIGYPGVLADYERYVGRVAYSVGDTDPGWLT